MNQAVLRNRVFGGTSQSWTGRCTPLDDIDFKVRPWVPHSGWPLARSELAPYFDRTAPYLGIAPQGYDGRLWHRPGEPELDTSLVRPYFWQHSQDATSPSKPMRFGPRFARMTAPIQVLHQRRFGASISMKRARGRNPFLLAVWRARPRRFVRKCWCSAPAGLRRFACCCVPTTSCPPVSATRMIWLDGFLWIIQDATWVNSTFTRPPTSWIGWAAVVYSGNRAVPAIFTVSPSVRRRRRRWNC
jgi:hypothetical protein